MHFCKNTKTSQLPQDKRARREVAAGGLQAACSHTWPSAWPHVSNDEAVEEAGAAGHPPGAEDGVTDKG